MNKKIFIFVTIIVLVVIFVVIYGYWLNTLRSKEKLEMANYISKYQGSDCAREGEYFSKVFIKKSLKENYENRDDLELYPENCCLGLYEHEGGSEQVINGKCINTGQATGWPVGRCLACGNGICDKHEDVCSCPLDCKNNWFSKLFY